MERKGIYITNPKARIHRADGLVVVSVDGVVVERWPPEQIDRMVRPPFQFERRTKHPAHNAVNALLNLGYTLLAGEIASRLESTGFDPRIGYYHGVRYGRSSLALDLIEAHRVDVIDRLTLSILNRRMLTTADFIPPEGAMGVRLGPVALRRYLNLYEAAMGEAPPGKDTPRTRIQEQVSDLRRTLMSAAARPCAVAGQG